MTQKTSMAQREMIADFSKILDETEEIATKYIIKYNSIEAAIEAYFDDPRNSKRKKTQQTDQAALSVIFEKFATDDPDALFEESLQNFFEAIDLEFNDINPIILAWKLNCSTPGEIKKEEFCIGLSRVGCGTIKSIQALVVTFPTLIADKKSFKAIYNWLFNFLKTNPQQKSLDLDTAIQAWSCILPCAPNNCFQDYPEFFKWLQANQSGHPYVSKDTWDNLVPFIYTINNDFNNHSEDDAWNTVLDAFAFHMIALKK